MTMRIAFHTLGCKVNQYETEVMKEKFQAQGFTIVDEEDSAEVYIINTCTVTNLADRKSRQYIRRMKKKCPNALVAVTGCYAQIKPEELEAMPEVDIVTGTGEKLNLVHYVLEALEQRSDDTIRHIIPYEQLCEYTDRGILSSMEGKTRAYIKIQEGCDRFCSYCLIPFARGHVRSRNMEEILCEAKNFIDKGYREIVLAGINTALYGHDHDQKEGIAPLIQALNQIPGDFRIRLSSLEPTVVNKEYVKKLLVNDKLCHHLHISIQSGSDQVIAAMNRHYTRAEYLEIVKVLREFDPEYGITTDIICGFPGETEADFVDSLRMVEEAGFLKVHAFKYSRRQGTRAEKMKHQVSGEIKNERMNRLLEAGECQTKAFLTSCIGKTREVLIEDQEKEMLTGYSDNYIKTYISVEQLTKQGQESLLNQIVEVEFIGLYLDGMLAKII